MGTNSTQRVRLDLVSPFIYTGPGAGTTGSTYSQFGLQGIKGGDGVGTYLVTGTSGANGVIYNGPIDHAMTTVGSGSGTWTVMNVPEGFNASSTSIYGVDNLGGGNVDLVGSYVSATLDPDSGTYPRIGFFYNGPITGSPSAEDFQSYQASDPVTGDPATFTYIHSIDGGLAVGNYDFLGDGNPAGNAFIYDPVTETQSAVNYGDHGKTHTAYGIWYNGGSAYTIAGGEGLNGIGDGRDGDPIGKATLIDYNSSTDSFRHYRTYAFTKSKALPVSMRNQALVTHFEGIWSDGVGLYKLPATIATADGSLSVAAQATVHRKQDGSFGKARWSLLDIPGSIITTNDSVFGDANIGAAIYSGPGGTSDYAGLVL